MPTFARTLVQQPILDALARWASIATGGVRVMQGDQIGSGVSPTGPAPTRPTPPCVVLELTGAPAQTTPDYERELASAPASATVTITAAEGAYVAFVVNLARPFTIGETADPDPDIDELPVQRGIGESLANLATRVAELMRAQLAGRVDIAVVGDDLVFTPVKHGDLFRAQAIEGVTVAVVDGAGARIVDCVHGCEVTVWVYGNSTSGQAGVAGAGMTTAEMTTALVSALRRPWCRALFDTFGMRRTNEPEVVTPKSRKNHALREHRAYFILMLGVASRYSLAPKPTSQVQFGLQVGQTPAPPSDPPPIEQEIEIDA